MPFRATTAFFTIATLVASSGPSLAGGGAIGCTNLPEYERAVGTIENGDQSCGMSMEEARKIIARHGQPSGEQRR